MAFMYWRSQSVKINQEGSLKTADREKKKQTKNIRCSHTVRRWVYLLSEAMAVAVSLQTTSRIGCIIGGEEAASIPAAPHPPDPQICSHTAVSGEAFTDCGTFE